MAVLSYALSIAALLISYSFCPVCGENAAERAGKITSNLYDTLRRIAFPLSPEMKDDKENVDSRFILMVPGKVLNFFDYSPGPEYTEFVQVIYPISCWQ